MLVSYLLQGSGQHDPMTVIIIIITMKDMVTTWTGTVNLRYDSEVTTKANSKKAEDGVNLWWILNGQLWTLTEQ